MTAHTIAHELQQTLDTYFDALTAAGKACPPDGGLSRRDAEREAMKAVIRNRNTPNSCVEAGE